MRGVKLISIQRVAKSRHPSRRVCGLLERSSGTKAFVVGV